MDCQNQCDCDENRCDFSTGCTNFTKGIASPCTLINMVINYKLYFQMIRTFLSIELLIFHDESLPKEMYFTSMT